ncbi:permease [Pseudoclavibacter sp. RFBJ3]|uniref:permease n=1 Tax=unclassified Pseudoclavibacter TaxID=2615177 RepID=UPI000CE8559A|nr:MULTISPECIES: permease [unclassified Pseudoclavibacter]PPF86605.1 permease [Pseudoclavibacter sp. RFBJ5]PPF94825.1 permease [Pseudoclavibacter sp. RFBH5]PPF95337.1 permease [Pseudoclavibacter sp. RFBJ3]PPG19502.1 permease [Pseudoclavibacter sp. RFBI4]
MNGSHEAGPLGLAADTRPTAKVRAAAPSSAVGTVSVPSPAPRGSSRIPLLTILRMLTRPDTVGRAAVALPAVAFAVVTALTLVVVGGTMMLFNPPPGMPSHGFFAVFALTLLAVPLLTLGVAAARLSARRRDDRLATLRLLGASTRVVTLLAVAEATLVAIAGILAGMVLYAALLPLVGLLHFYGAPIGAASVWVGFPVLLATAAGITLLAALSSFAGLAAVRVTPLGVRKRGTQPRVKWFALASGVVILLISLGLVGMMQGLASAFGMIGIVIAVLVPLAAGMLALNLIGSPLVGLIGRQMAKRAKSPARLIGGRRLAETPGVAWRSVSGIAMIAFVAVIGGSGLALLDMVGTSGMQAEDLILMTDLRTGVFLTLFIAFLMLACTVGVSQAAAILDERKLLISLDRAGMPRKVFEQAQRVQVWAPLLLAALGGAGAAAAIILPIVGASLIIAPLAMLTMALCFALGFGAVWLALLGTRPVVTSVLASAHRG